MADQQPLVALRRPVEWITALLLVVSQRILCTARQDYLIFPATTPTADASVWNVPDQIRHHQTQQWHAQVGYDRVIHKGSSNSLKFASVY